MMMMRRSLRLVSTRLMSSLPTATLPADVRRFSAAEREDAVYRAPIKAVILDWSGTTADAHVIAPAVVFYDVFKLHGCPISMKEARLPMGLRKDLHIAKILEIPEVQKRWKDAKGKSSTQDDVDSMFKDFVPMQLEALSKYTTLIPGAREAVNLLRSKYNCKIGCTTGFTKVMVDVLLKDAKFQGLELDSSVAGDEVKNDMGWRPAPFMVYENLVQLGVFPIQAVVKVDDTVSGVGEGLSAGCWSVGIAGLSNYTNVDTLEQWENMSAKDKESRVQDSRDKLFASGAHYVIDSIASLPAVINDINARLAAGDKP